MLRQVLPRGRNNILCATKQAGMCKTISRHKAVLLCCSE